MPALTRAEAAEVLGVSPTAHPEEVRRAFRSLLRSVHPDVNPAADAAAATLRLTAAYQVLSAARPAPPPEAAPGVPRRRPAAVQLEDARTIVVGSTRAGALAALIDAGHRLGEISYLDRGAGLLEVVVELVDAPTTSLVVSLQDRGPVETALSCSVEPLRGGDAPRPDAVVRLLLRTLRGEDPAS